MPSVLPVIAGPSEATAIGNIMIQAVAAGQAADIASMRQLLSHAIQFKNLLSRTQRDMGCSLSPIQDNYSIIINNLNT